MLLGHREVLSERLQSAKRRPGEDGKCWFYGPRQVIEKKHNRTSNLTFAFPIAAESAKRNPTYGEVCSGTTQQIEVYDLQYGGNDLNATYEYLCR